MPAIEGPTTDHALPRYGCEVTVRPGGRDDHVVLAVRGVLSAAAGDGGLRRVLCAQLLDRGRVVVDLAEATVPWGPVVDLFPAALAAAGGWPLARLVLARADPVTARILQASRVHLTVPLATTLAEARILLEACPYRAVRDHELPCGPTAPALARAAVASAHDDWGLDDGLYEAATTVATELVTNAVEHAGTSCVLHLALDPRRLHVAVRDGRPVAGRRPGILVPGGRGYGLLIVCGLSRSWGVTPQAGGKSVWAVFDLGRDPLDCV